MRRKRQHFAKRLFITTLALGVMVAFSFQATLSGKQEKPFDQDSLQIVFFEMEINRGINSCLTSWSSLRNQQLPRSLH